MIGTAFVVLVLVTCLMAFFVSMLELEEDSVIEISDDQELAEVMERTPRAWVVGCMLRGSAVSNYKQAMIFRRVAEALEGKALFILYDRSGEAHGASEAPPLFEVFFHQMLGPGQPHDVMSMRFEGFSKYGELRNILRLHFRDVQEQSRLKRRRARASSRARSEESNQRTNIVDVEELEELNELDEMLG